MTKPRPRSILLGILLASVLAAKASAHPAQFTTLQVTVEPSGRFHAILNIDILSYALGKPSADTSNEELQAILDSPRPTLAAALADAGERFRREIVIHTDAGDAPATDWELPGLREVDAVLARKIKPPIVMPGEIAFSGTLPAGAHTVSIRLPFVLGDTLHLYELPDGQSHDEPVSAGDYSSNIAVKLSPTALAPQTAPRSGSRALVAILAFALILLALSAPFLQRRLGS